MSKKYSYTVLFLSAWLDCNFVLQHCGHTIIAELCLFLIFVLVKFFFLKYNKNMEKNLSYYFKIELQFRQAEI